MARATRCPKLADERRRLFGYAARGVPYGPDDGTLAGWAALASLPFAPEIVLRAARNMMRRYPEMLSGQRYASSFNPTLASADRRAWVSAGHFGLDQGIVVMMIENYRTRADLAADAGLPLYRAPVCGAPDSAAAGCSGSVIHGSTMQQRNDPSQRSARTRTSANGWTMCIHPDGAIRSPRTGTTWWSSAPARRDWSRRTPRRRSARRSR